MNKFYLQKPYTVAIYTFPYQLNIISSLFAIKYVEKSL